MTTTYAWLEQYNSASLALSLVIEGIPTVYSTANLDATYSNDAAPYDQWNDPTGGLQIKGSLHQAVKLYAQDLEPESFSFRIIDPEGTLASLLREGYSSGHRTYLTSAIDAGATSTINVKSTTGFASSGTLYIGDEAIVYTGKTGTTFTGITRATYAVNLTNAGTAFAPAHTIGNNVTVSATTAPAVTDYPKTWFGRFVHLFLHVMDPLTGQYNRPSEAVKLWSGRIQSYGDDGDGGYSIDAKSSIDLLYKPVGMEQWRGHCNEGRVFYSTEDSMTVFSSKGNYNPLAALTSLSDGEPKSHEDICAAVNTQFESWRSAVTTSAGDLWDLTLTDTGDGGPPRYRFTLQPNTTAVVITDRVEVSVNIAAWAMLGFGIGMGLGSTPVTGTGDRIITRALRRTNDNRWELTAPGPPIVSFGFSRIPNTTIAITDEIGTFYTQTAAEIEGAPPDVNGVVSVNGGALEGIFAVKYVSGTPSTIRLLAELDAAAGRFVALQYGNATQGGNNGSEWEGAYYLGQVQEPPVVKQAWFTTGPAGTLLLQALLSTSGGTGYNHATYDVLAWGGCGVPASLVDVNSWKSLNDAYIQFLVTEPRPFYEYLEPVLNVTNRYMVWKAATTSSNPRMTVMRPTFDTSEQLDWALTESNKFESPGRMRVRRGVEGVINRVVVKFGNGILGDETGAKQIIVEDIASQSDYGRRRTVTLSAPLVTNVTSIAIASITPALAYCSRPLAVAQRTYNASLIRMCPGDSVSVTDNYAVDPATGTRGAVLYGWVLGTDFDLSTGRGIVEIVFLPEKVSRVAKFAPSAKVASYDAGTKTLTTVAHEFSTTGSNNDSASFIAGDKAHVYEMDAASPLEWSDTIAAVGNNTLQVTTGLTAPAFDSAKTYVVEYDDITTAVTLQRTRAYIADDADLSTGGVITTAFDWGSDGHTTIIGSLGLGTPTVDYTPACMEPPTAGYAEKGQPLSVHKLYYAARACNNLLGYKTRNVYINNYLQNSGTITGTTTTLLYIAWIPIYGHVGLITTRNLVCRLRGMTSSGTSTFTIRSAPTAASGQSFASVTYPYGSTSNTFATTSTSLVWSSELTLTCSAQPALSGNDLWGTWITVEGVASAGGVTATLSEVFVCEAELA